MVNRKYQDAITELRAVMPDHNRVSAEILRDFEQQHLIPEGMRAGWLRRCIEEQVGFVAEAARSFGEQEGHERAVAQDPLRRKLSYSAIEAILTGQALVIPVLEAKKFDLPLEMVIVNDEAGEEFIVRIRRIGTPSEPSI